MYRPFVFSYFEKAPFILSVLQADVFGHFLLHSYSDTGLYSLSILMGRNSTRESIQGLRVKEKSLFL